VVKLKIINWRCIDVLELELSKINVFIGPNSSGKSSLAYAIYLASKSSRSDPLTLIQQLYGHGFDKIARFSEERSQFPIVIKLNDSELRIELVNGEIKIVKPSSSPWKDEYLLPSKRVGFIQVLMILPKLINEILKRSEAIFIASFAKAIFDLITSLPLLPPLGLFAADYLRATTGISVESLEGEFKGAGSYILKVSMLMPLTELIFQDIHTKLNLPVELAPDGLVDFAIIDSLMKKIPKDSLVVIEEPEIHKNPLKIVEFTEHIVDKILERNLTLVVTTQSDIPLLTIGKLISRKVLDAENVKIYYFTREPWTRIREIKVYSDGTFETLPDSEELITHLF
jgi:energy-coupling factor transporter ATP-binding protein EcfA2